MERQINDSSNGLKIAAIGGGFVFLVISPVIIVLCIFNAASSIFTEQQDNNQSCSTSENKPDDWPMFSEIWGLITGKEYTIVNENDKTYYVICSKDGSGAGSGGITGEIPEGLENWIRWVENPENWNSKTNSGSPGINIDGAFGAQCVDISKTWLMSKLSLKTPPLLTAVDGNGNPVSGGAGFPPNRVSRASDKVKAGDIIFYVFGHTAVAINDEDPAGNFKVVEQNPQSPHEKVYSRKQVLSFWRVA